MPAVSIYFNLHPDHLSGYVHGHPVQEVFSYEAPNDGEPMELADEAFRAFNAPPELVYEAYRELAEQYRAAGHRSLSVGDLVVVDDVWLACASVGWVRLERAPSELIMTSPPIDLLVVTPAGEVRDYAVLPGETRLITASSILQALYQLIGCSSVDVVRLTPEIDMWVDDAGLLKEHPPRINQLASYIATRFGYPFQLYAGTAVFSGGADQAGYTLPLGKPARQALLDLIAELRSIPEA